MLLFLLLLNSAIGWLVHKVVGLWLDDVFTPKTSRLIGYWTGLTYDTFSSWAILREYGKRDCDRRKSPITFERYVFVRFIAGLTLWFGVALGYLTDES